MILNLGLPAIDSMPGGMRTIDGLFQALGVRTGGFYIESLSSFAPALLVAFLVGMYISSLPSVIAMRQTNVYEEKSIGLQSSSEKTKVNLNPKTLTLV